MKRQERLESVVLSGNQQAVAERRGTISCPSMVEDRWSRRAFIKSTAAATATAALALPTIVPECVTGEPEVRCIFEGTEGMLRVDANGDNLVTIPERLRDVQLGPSDVRLGTSTDHQQDFLDATKSRSDPSAPVEVGHRSATVCHLGNIAMRLEASLSWDPAREQFVGRGSEEANAMVHRSGRSPWNV